MAFGIQHALRNATGGGKKRRRTPSTPLVFAPTKKGAAAEKKYQRSRLNIDLGPVPTEDTGPSLVDTLKSIATINVPGSSSVREYTKDEAQNLLDVAREHAETPGQYNVLPDEKQAKALGVVLGPLPIGKAEEGASAVESVASLLKAARAAEKGADEGGQLAKALAKVGDKATAKAEQIRSAPATLRKEAEDLATKEGRRLAARRAASASASKAAQHPVIAGTGALAALHRGGANVPGGNIADALWTGHLAALGHDPVGTVETTGRALAGSVAAPAALLYSGAQSIAQGNPAPFEKTAKTQAAGLKEIADELLSGDPKTVQKAVESDVGLSFLAPLPAVTRLKGYERLRSGVRDAAKSGRKAVSEKTGIPLRHGPGEQNVFGFTERRGARKRVAKLAQRETAPWRMRASRHAAAVTKEARKIKGARSLKNVHGIEGGDVLQTLAEYGVNSPEQLALLRERGPVGDVPRKGDVNLRSVLDHLDANPHLLDDKHLARALEHYRASVEALPATKAGKGRRAAAGPQGELFGVRAPEDRVPHATRAFTNAEDRAGAWKDLREAEKTAKTVRTEARKTLAQADVAKGAEKEALKAKARSLYSLAKKADAEAHDFRKTLDPYTRPGGAVSSSVRRKLYDAKLLDEYVGEVNAKAGAQGMEPGVYTKHAPLRQEGEAADAATIGNAATRVQHVRKLGEGSLASRDAVDRSLTGLVAGSIQGPRLRAGGQDFARQFFTKESVPLRIGGEVKRRISQKQFSEAIRDGQISEHHYVWVPERNYKQGFVDTMISPEQIHAGIMDALKGEVSQERVGAQGVVVPKEAFKEYGAQINPTQWAAARFLDVVGKGVSRTLLFSPGWVASQVFAEGLPILLAKPSLLNPLKIAKLERRLKQFNNLHPEEAAGWAATMGEAPVRVETARELQPHFVPTHEMFSNGARAIEHNPIGRALFSTARLRPLALFDQWRHGKYQTLLAAAEVDKRFNGFLTGLQGALRTEKGLSDELRGMSPVDQLHALTQPRYRSELDKLADYQDAITGNWTAYTHYERTFAPLGVFYGFMRYAFRWPLTFAKAHPMTATLDYFLAQQNANQIEKLLGGKPAQFYQFANPVVQDAEGNSSWLPGGARIAPGLSTPAQGVLDQNAPAAAIGSTNPLLGAGIGLFTGTDSFGGHDYNEGPLGLHLSLAAKQLISMPPVARLLGVGQSESDTAKELRALDPNRKLRSFAAPWLPQSGPDARKSNEIIQELDSEGSSSSSSSSSSAPWKSSGSSTAGTAPWK